MVAATGWAQMTAVRAGLGCTESGPAGPADSAGPADPASPADAARLPIAGLSRFSMVDWPGQLVATVFTQGCSWRCPYCHNPELQAICATGQRQPMSATGQQERGRAGAQLSWAQVEEFLSTRAGQLDGVVFSGGEPTRHRALVPAMRRARQLGFAVGLHTNGMYPARLRDILAAGVVDWIGLDIKAAAPAYPVAIGRSELSQAASHVWESLELVRDLPQYEVRTTLFDDPRITSTLPDLARELVRAGVSNWVVQKLRMEGTTDEFRHSYSPMSDADMEEVIAELRRIMPGLKVR